jgi:hypothetical protein
MRRSGIDDHRYGRVRPAPPRGRPLTASGAIDVDDCECDTAEVLGIVDGRESAAVSGCLAGPSPAWRNRIQVLAIAPSAPFRKTIRQLPRIPRSASTVHLVQLASLMLTRVRQRLARKREQRRGRKVDLACTRRIAEAHSRSGNRSSRRDFAGPAERSIFTVSKRNSAQLQWRASSIRRTLAATLSGQLAKPSHLPVANRSSHHCTASDTVKDSSVIIACKAAPARCSVAAIVASRSPSAVKTSTAGLSMRPSRSARSRRHLARPEMPLDGRPASSSACP